MKPISKRNDIEEILSSFDGIKRAEAPAFFFERIQAKLTSEGAPYFGKIKRTFPSPGLAIKIIPFVILLDFAGFQLQEKKDIVTTQYDDSGLSSENDLDEALFYAGLETADAFDLEYY